MGEAKNIRVPMAKIVARILQEHGVHPGEVKRISWETSDGNFTIGGGRGTLEITFKDEVKEVRQSIPCDHSGPQCGGPERRRPGVLTSPHMLRDELDKLDGKGEYTGGSNICRDDAYFAQSLEKKYGYPLEQLRRIAGPGYEEGR